MERQTEFNLEKTIRAYIQSLNSTDLLTDEESDEVFDHWMTETEVLIQSGLNEREAYEVVKLRFGNVAQVEKEYRKSKPTHAILQFLLGGILFYSLVRLTVVSTHLLFHVFLSGNLSTNDINILFFGKPLIFILSLILIFLFIRRKLVHQEQDKKKLSLKRIVIPTLLLLVGLEFCNSFKNIYFFSQSEGFELSSIYFWLGTDSNFPMFISSILLLIITFYFILKGNKNISLTAIPE